MNFLKIVTLCALAAAPQAYASGSSAPRPTPQPVPAPAPEPAPAPQPEPAPVDPTLGTRFATLRTLWEQQPATPPQVGDSPTWAEYQANPTISCTQILLSDPDSFDNDVLLLRMKPVNYYAGPAFPADRGDKYIVARYSALGNYNDEGISKESWEYTSQVTLGNNVQMSYGERYRYVFKKNGHLIVWHQTEVGNANSESYGYCFPKSEANPF